MSPQLRSVRPHELASGRPKIDGDFPPPPHHQEAALGRSATPWLCGTAGPTIADISLVRCDPS